MARTMWETGSKLIVGTLVLAVLGLGLGACAPLKPIVAVYGDSLVWEAQAAIAFQLGNTYDTRITSFGGTAPCDYQEQIRSDSRTQKPALVVLAFSGNALTPCMQPPAGRPNSEAWIAEKYQADLSSITEDLSRTGVPSVLVGAPPRLVAVAATATATATTTDPAAAEGSITSAVAARVIGSRPDGYRSADSPVDAPSRELVAAQRRRGIDTTFVDGGALLRAPDGGWTKVQPCLLFEGPAQGCSGGLIDVRAADTAHFWPGTAQSTAGVVSGCPTWSSGAWRYAATITGFVRFRLAGTIGSLDVAAASPTNGRVTVGGWALDPWAGTDAIAVHVYVDGKWGGAVTADRTRADVGAVYPFAGAGHGFTLTLPSPLNRGTHTVCAYVIDGTNPSIGCHTLTVNRTV